MQTSDAFLDLRIHFECSGNLDQFLTPYKDSAGIWTIGIGTIHYPDGTAVKDGDTCDIDQAKDYAAHDTKSVEAFVNKTLTTPVTQSQFDAICDFAYNVGTGAWQSSSLRIAVNENPSNYPEITIDFLKWDKAHVNGELVELAGLLRRRKCEAYLYKNGVNHPTFFDDTLSA